MKTTLSLSFLIFVAVSTGYGQKSETFKPKIDADKPGVYVGEHDSTPKRVETRSSEVWLQLSNNYSWSIRVCQYDKTEITKGILGLHYRIEAIDNSQLSKAPDPDAPGPISLDKPLPQGRPTFDFCDDVELKSGEKILFSVPREHFVRWGRLKVSFYMQWEEIDRARTGREPLHSVYFYSRKLVVE